MNRRLSRAAIVPLAIALAGGLSADTVRHPEMADAYPAGTVPSAAVLATGQYACKLTNVTDMHREPEGATLMRDELHLTLKLTPQPRLVSFLTKYPQGNAPGMSWLSPGGVAFRRLNTPLPDQYQLRQVGGDAFTPTFHDDKSPTGDNLNPTFELTPSEHQPIGTIDDVYLKSEVLQHTADGTIQTTLGYTLCGSVRHDGQLAWSQIPSGAAAVPSFAVAFETSN
ncbi:MAG TPA: hypothetical protein VLH86_05665 [Patescibacteria group bacterium]|nr:hypothetical protein [Patescibacteria group bacterium]